MRNSINLISPRSHPRHKSISRYVGMLIVGMAMMGASLSYILTHL